MIDTNAGVPNPGRYVGRYDVNATHATWTPFGSGNFTSAFSAFPTMLPSGLRPLTLEIHNTGSAPFYVLLGTSTANTTGVPPPGICIPPGTEPVKIDVQMGAAIPNPSSTSPFPTGISVVGDPVTMAYAQGYIHASFAGAYGPPP